VRLYLGHRLPLGFHGGASIRMTPLVFLFLLGFVLPFAAALLLR
jgi:hypothetical protein